MARRGRLVAACAVLAFAQTMAYYVYLRDDPGNYNGAGAQGDQVAYIALAQQVLNGTWDGAVHYMPGLPAVIALSQLIFGALTEFLTGVVLFALVAVTFVWSKRPTLRGAVGAGLLIALAGYLRSEYLGLAVLFALIVGLIGRSWRIPTVLVATVVAAMAPWVVRYAVVTGQPALYNESPLSNLVLMGTWFRVFDEQTFAQLQQIETAPGPREQAIERASSVGPRPELSRRYMEQARGPYERPLGETLQLAADNIRINLRQYLTNHLLLAPVLIWAGHTPIRQVDAPALPSSARYAIWAAEFALLLLAVWQSALALRDRRTQALGLSFLAIVLFITGVHILIAVDERFTTPALPLIGLFAGARLGLLVRARRSRLAVGYAA